MKVPDGYIEKLIDEYHDVLVKCVNVLYIMTRIICI